MVEPYVLFQGIGVIVALAALSIVTVMKRRSGCRCRIASEHAASKCQGNFMELPRVCLLITFAGLLVWFLVSLKSW